MSIRDELVSHIHARNEFDYDECGHGTYSGGPNHGEPYAMCERQADALLPLIEKVQAEAKAEALREAAREIEDTLVNHRRTLGMSTQQWLTDRAAAIWAASETEGNDHD